MGDDDDMVKKAVYLGTTLEWAQRAAGSKTRAFIVATTVEVSPRRFVPPWRRQDIEVTVQR